MESMRPPRKARATPTEADWNRMTGETPRVYWRDDHALAYVYHPKNRAVVETMPDRTNDVVWYTRPDGTTVDVPSYLLWELHGAPCERRSGQTGGDAYDRVPEDMDPAEFIARRDKVNLTDLPPEL